MNVIEIMNQLDAGNRIEVGDDVIEIVNLFDQSDRAPIPVKTFEVLRDDGLIEETAPGVWERGRGARLRGEKLATSGRLLSGGPSE